MKKVSFLFILLSIVLSSPVAFSNESDFNDHGANRKLLVINPLNSDVELTDVEKRMINKVTIKVCAKQRGYQIALGEIGIAKNANFAILNLELSLLSKENGIEVTAILLDEAKKQVIAKSATERVQRLHLMRSIESALNFVFSRQKK